MSDYPIDQLAHRLYRAAFYKQMEHDESRTFIPWNDLNRSDRAMWIEVASEAKLALPSAPVEAGTAALGTSYIEECITRYREDQRAPFTAMQAEAQLLALKRAAAGRDVVIAECLRICASEAEGDEGSTAAAAYRRLRAMQSPPATGEVNT